MSSLKCGVCLFKDLTPSGILSHSIESHPNEILKIAFPEPKTKKYIVMNYNVLAKELSDKTIAFDNKKIIEIDVKADPESLLVTLQWSHFSESNTDHGQYLLVPVMGKQGTVN